MKHITRLFLIFTLLALFALPIGALAAAPNDGLLSGRPDQFVFGDNFILESGNTLSGNLWVFGGNAELREGSRVTGDIMLFGGNLRINGMVDGNINAAGGNVHLRNNAVIRGDVNVMGGSISRDSGAQVEGDILDNRSGPFRFPGIAPIRMPNINIANPFLDFIGFLFQSLLTAALAVLLALFLPVQTERVARTVVVQPLISGGLGLLTVIVVPILMLVLLITIILIPVSLVLGIILALAILFGWIAVGFEVGKRMSVLFKSQWSLPLAAGLGTLTLSLIIGGAGRYLFCIGWLFPTAVALVGLGAVLLTRFGTQNYPPHSALPYTPAAPPPSVPPYTPSAPDLGPGEVYPPHYDAPGSRGEDYPLEDSPGSSSGGAGVYPVDDDAPSR